MRYINKNDVLIIIRNMGLLMIGIGLMCLVPIIIDFVYLEGNAIYFLMPALISIYLGLIVRYSLNKPGINKVRVKHAMLISSLSWLWAALVCGVILFLATDKLARSDSVTRFSPSPRAVSIFLIARTITASSLGTRLAI